MQAQWRTRASARQDLPSGVSPEEGKEGIVMRRTNDPASTCAGHRGGSREGAWLRTKVPAPRLPPGKGGTNAARFSELLLCAFFRPSPGQALANNFVMIRFELVRPNPAGGDNNFVIQLDSRDPVNTSENEYTFTGMSPGATHHLHYGGGRKRNAAAGCKGGGTLHRKIGGCLAASAEWGQGGFSANNSALLEDNEPLLHRRQTLLRS